MRFENPFASPAPSSSKTPERSTHEEKEFKNRMNLGSLWAERRITPDLLTDRGLSPGKQEIMSFLSARARHEQKNPHGIRRSEEADYAEAVFLEGADANGVTKVKAPYAWFEDSVVAYPAHPYDDVLRGTDAVLMFLDAEDERRAYPVAVDVTIDRLAYDRKFQGDLSRMTSHPPHQVYWAESTAEAGTYLDAPKEGMVRALKVSVYLPPSEVKTYLNRATSNSDADRVMERLGPFVLRQFQSELEAQALKSLQLDPRDVEHLSQHALLQMLTAPASGQRLKSENETRQLLSHVLPTVWESVRNLGGVTSAREDILPESIRERSPLSRRATSVT